MKCFALALLALILFRGGAQADTIAELIAKLKSPDVEVRLEAAEQLGQQKAVEAILILREVKKNDDNVHVRKAAKKALQNMGSKSVPTYLKLLAQADETDKAEFLEILIELKPDAHQTVPALKEEMKSESLDIRRRTTLLLGELSGNAKLALPLLFEAAGNPANLEQIGSPEGTVCELAIRSAKKIDPDCLEKLAAETLPFVLKELNGGDEIQSDRASYVLAQLDQYAESALQDILNYRSRKSNYASYERTRSHPLDALLLRRFDPAKLLTLPKLHPAVQLKSLQLITQSDWPSERRLIAFKSALLSQDILVRSTAFKAIIALGDKAKSVLPELCEALKDQEVVLEERDSYFPNRDFIPQSLIHFGRAVVPQLLEIAKDSKRDDLMRCWAAATLTRLSIRGKLTSREIEPLLNDPKTSVAALSAAAYLFAGGDPNLGMVPLKAGLQSTDPKANRAALKAVVFLGPRVAEVAPLLVRHFDNPLQQNSVAEAISRIGPIAKIPQATLEPLLKPTDSTTCLIAINALKQMKPAAKETLPIILKHLPDYNRDQMLAALSFMETLGHEAAPAVSTLIELRKLTSRNYQDRSINFSAGEVLGSIGPKAKEAIPSLVLDLTKGDPTSARALGKMGPVAISAVPRLGLLLEQKNLTDQIWASYALHQITENKKPHLERLLAILDKILASNPKPMREIAQALALIGQEAHKSQDKLLQALFDPQMDLSGKEEITRALSTVSKDPKSMISPLQTHLKKLQSTKHSENEQALILRLLGNFGPQSKSAILDIRRLLDHPSEEVVNAAFDALYLIEGK